MLNVKRQLLKRFLYFIVFILVTGCVTALPMKHVYKSQEIFPVPFNEIWEVSNNFLEENVAAIDTADKKSGFLKTKEFDVPQSGFQYQSEYADCGNLGGLYTYHKIVGYYEIFISETEENSTAVRIIPHYHGSLWLGKSFKGWIPCQSKGYVEQLLMDDVRAKVQASRIKKALGRQLNDGVVKKSDKESTTDNLKIQDIDKKGAGKPEIPMIPETEFEDLMIKYENAIQESENLRNEITRLKRNNIFENNKKYSGETGLSITESPPELPIIADDDVTPKLPLKKTDKEDAPAAEPLRRGNNDNSQFYTIQTGSFLELNRAQEQFNLITELLQPKEYDNLRIEKISSYYTVRLGKYDDYASAEDLLKKLIREIKSAIVLKAYIKESRIMKRQSTQFQ